MVKKNIEDAYFAMKYSGMVKLEKIMNTFFEQFFNPSFLEIKKFILSHSSRVI